MTPRLRTLAAPLGLGLSGLLLFGSTLAPTVTGTDAGELALAAHSGGIAHAPGFPTWTALAWLVAQLSIAQPIWRLNAFSALAAAAALVTLWYWLQQATTSSIPTETGPSPSPRRSRRARPFAHLPLATRHLPISLSFAVVLSLAAGRSFWPWATTTEVYALNAFLVALALFGLFRWSSPHSQGGERQRNLALVGAALAYGLALSAHLATTALIAPAILFWLVRHGQRLPARLFVAAALALALGLATYAWLPLRAASDPVLNWGEPDTLHRFWRHVTAAQYRSNISLAPASVLAELRFGLGLTFWQFGPLGAPLIAWGLVWGWRRQRSQTLFVLIGAIASVAYAVLYSIEDDQDAYYILAHILLLLPLLWGLGQALQVLPRLGWRQHVWAAALALLLPAAAILANYPASNRADYWYHHDYFHNLTSEVPAGGTVFTRDWQFYSPALYYQGVEGVRPDLRIIDVELMRRDWYLNHLQRWYPDLTGPAQAELSAYRRLRDAWERDPRGFERNPGDVIMLQEAYISAINALIAAADAVGAVHMGLNQERGVGAGYQWAPVGLTFRLFAPDSPPPDLPEMRWDTNHLTGRWSRLPDEPARKVVRVHALMLQNRAIYLATLGDAPGALAALDLAEQLLPGDPVTAQLRAQLLASPP